MKILHVSASLSPTWGGPVSVISSLTKSLSKINVECTVLATKGIRTGFDQIDLKGVETKVFPNSWLAHLWTGHSPSLADELLSIVPQYDLVHIHELWHFPHLAAYRAAIKHKKPYIITVHGSLYEHSLKQKKLQKHFYMKLFQRKTLENAAALQAFNDIEKEKIVNLGLRSRTVVIPNGVDVENFDSLPPRFEFERRFTRLGQKRIVLYLGRIHPSKGLGLLASAFGDIVRNRRDTYLIIAGPRDGNYADQLEETLRSAGALENTIFVGMLTGYEKLVALGAADIFVMPSYSEGFSMAVLEAMASRLPVVITEGCHFPEVAKSGAGLTVAAKPDELRDAINYLLDRPGEGAVMGRLGYKLVSEHYSWAFVAERMKRLYSQCLTNELTLETKKTYD